ncbi:MAG: hypothetical protein K2L21_00195 [Muribaculaceae bacterium]|nr:hypothetical protein [Muribaculaceae bacterium]
MKRLYLTFAIATCLLASHNAQAEDSEWKSLGMGQYTDGWVTPGIFAPATYTDPTPYIYEVEVFESTSTPGMYKIASPYTSDYFPFLDKNTASTPCDIVIDATDPTFVRIAPQNSGFVCSTLTVNFTDPFYVCNAGWYFEAEGNTVEAIKDYGYASTLSDGAIEIIGPKFGKSADVNDQGYNWQGGYNGRLVLPAGDTAAGWTEIGKCTYQDGFILAGWYLTDPAKHMWKVPIEEKDDTPGLYRLINPYLVAGNPMLSVNINTGNAYILVDATDPDIVVITPQFSGFSGSVDQTDRNFYIGNMAGTLVANDYWTKDEIKQYAPQRIDTMSAGVITINNTLYGFNASSDFGYVWTDYEDQPLTYPAKIFMPGVDAGVSDVAADADFSEEYYNLQGIRVANPEPGNVYIRHRGTHTEKVIIR